MTHHNHVLETDWEEECSELARRGVPLYTFQVALLARELEIRSQASPDIIVGVLTQHPLSLAPDGRQLQVGDVAATSKVFAKMAAATGGEAKKLESADGLLDVVCLQALEQVSKDSSPVPPATPYPSSSAERNHRLPTRRLSLPRASSSPLLRSIRALS